MISDQIYNTAHTKTQPKYSRLQTLILVKVTSFHREKETDATYMIVQKRQELAEIVKKKVRKKRITEILNILKN